MIPKIIYAIKSSNFSFKFGSDIKIFLLIYHPSTIPVIYAKEYHLISTEKFELQLGQNY